MFIDSHAHIQLAQFDADRGAVIRRARDAGIDTILVIGFDLETSLGAIDVAEKHKNVYATVGMHPHDAEYFTSDVLKTFRELSAHPKVLALGEMGLDYYRNRCSPLLQKKVFEQQLALAVETALPIVIHNRDAYMDILPILEAQQEKVRGVLHCFTGDVQLMRRSLELSPVCEMYIGIGGIVTYRNAAAVHGVAREVPEERLLIETDCPWLAPQFRRGKRNEPAYVAAVAQKIAELRGTSAEAIGKSTSQNFHNLFLDISVPSSPAGSRSPLRYA